MKRIWEWYGIAGAFFLGVLVVFLGGFGASAWLGARPLARMLLAPTVGLVGVAVVLAVICWILSTKQPCEPDWGLWGKCLVLGVVVGLFLVGFAVLLVCHSGRGTNAAQTIVLAVQTLVLAITAGFVVWYASAAQRQAEILKDQFDVQYTPHLRPTVSGPAPENKEVIIRLTNLSGAAAIHPGLYPQWLPGEKNAALVREPCTGPPPCLPTGDYFTCTVIQVGEAWLCRVVTPQARDRRGQIEVRWHEPPWGERDKHKHTWTLKPNAENEEEWDFEYGPEE